MSKKFFVKIVIDPEVDLRKCVVGVACAAQAIKDGYDVDVFFALRGPLESIFVSSEEDVFF